MAHSRSFKKGTGKAANPRPKDFWVKNNPAFRELLISLMKAWKNEPIAARKNYVMATVIPELNSCAEKNRYTIQFDSDDESDHKRVHKWLRYNYGYIFGNRKTVRCCTPANVTSRSGCFQRRDAVQHVFQKKIREHMKKHKQQIKDYYSAIDDVLDKLSGEEIVKLDKYVNRMNDPNLAWPFQPLTRNEVRSVRKKTVQFAHALEKEYGCHILILTAFSEEDHSSNTSTSSYETLLPIEYGPQFSQTADFNKAFENFNYYIARLGDTVENQGFAVFEHMNFRRDMFQTDSSVPMIIPTTEDGWPMIPEEVPPTWGLADKKDFIKSFVTMQYRLCLGRTATTRVPWALLEDNNDEWLLEGSLPPGVQLREPSKLKEKIINALIQHWRERALAGQTAFAFIGSNVEGRRPGDTEPVDVEEQVVEAKVIMGRSQESEDSGEEDEADKPQGSGKDKAVDRHPHRPRRSSHREDFGRALDAIGDDEDGEDDEDDEDDEDKANSTTNEVSSGLSTSQRRTRSAGTRASEQAHPMAPV